MTAHRRHGPCHPRRNADRRHAAAQAPAPALRSAARATDDAGATGAACFPTAMRRACSARSSASFLTSCMPSSPPSAANCCRWPSPALPDFAPEVADHRPQRHRRPAGPVARLDRRAGRAASGGAADRAGRRAARTRNPAGAPSACPGPDTRPPMPFPNSTRSSRRTARLSFSSTPARRRKCCSRACGRRTTTTCPLHCITARSTSSSAARSKAPWPTGRLQAVVCTSTLDLGIDWGDVDLVVQIGAPKGASRMLQRIGRANHRLDEPSRALFVPANRFEVLECEAALEAVTEGAQDSEDPVSGGLDVLAQHVLGCACHAPFDADALYAEIRRAWPYRDLERTLFDRVVEFVATGGYALRAYERYARLSKTKDGLWRIANPQVAQQYRLNVGTIVEEPMVKVRLVRGRGETRGAVTGPIGRGGRRARRDGGVFLHPARARRHLPVRRRDRRLRGDARQRSLCIARPCQEPEDPAIHGRQVSALDLSRRTGAAHARRSACPGTGCRNQVRDWLRLQQPAKRGARRRNAPRRNLPARGQEFSRLLSLRGPAGPPDAGYAADPPARTGPGPAARLRRLGIRPRRLGRRRPLGADRDPAAVARRRCSTRTCSATISRPGSTNRS